MVTTSGVILFYVLPALLLAEVVRCVYLEHRSDRIPILLYHRLVARRDIGKGGAEHEPTYVSFDDVFESQMRWLSEKGFTTLDLDQFLAIRRDRASPPPRAVVLTFDDGYESVYTLAWPVLRRLGLKATVFVAPRPDDYTRNLVRGVDGFLSPDQMRELDRGGVRIESHTLTHCVLSDFDDPSARRELAESKRLLGEIVGRPVRHLAVPRSGHSLRVRRLAREEGYVTVCCNAKGSSNGLSSLLALPRIVIERDTTPADFARALEPARAVVLRLVGNLKRVPAVIFGSKRTQAIRRRLARGPLRGLLLTRHLVRLVAAGALLYAAGIALFTWYLASR